MITVYTYVLNHFEQIVDVMTEAFHILGLPMGDVNSEKFENKGFWRSIPLALDNGARRGTFRQV